MKKKETARERITVMRIGNRYFTLDGHTYVMGILNVTPDSFSDGGSYDTAERALRQAERMIADGADMIDVGGESTRPGYTPVSADEEIRRIVPVIRAIKSRFDIPVSLDTYKAKTARAGLEAGADLINDVYALSDDAMGPLLAEAGVPCCLMHSIDRTASDNFVEDWLSDIAAIIKKAQAAGIRREQLILDPGVGFGKTYEQNLLCIRHMSRLQSFDLPVLLGTSRKSVIGNTLHVPAAERAVGTAATTVLAAERAIDFVRVHDVKENVQAIQMTEAVLLQDA